MKKTLMGAMLLTVVLVATACAKDSVGGGSSGGGSSLPASSAGPSRSIGGSSGGSGGDISLGGFGIQESPSLSFPELEAGARAAMMSINAAGGVAGRQLAVDYCNDGADPNKAATCARGIVSSGAVAVVGSLTFGGSQAVPLFEAAGMADIGTLPISPIEFTSKNVFLIDGGGLSVYESMPILIHQLKGVKTIGVIYSDSPAKALNEQLIEDGSAKVGVKIIKSVTVPANSTDISPYLNDLKSSAPDAVVSLLTPQDQIKAWQAARSVGLDLPLMAGTGGAPLEAVKAAGGAAEGTYISSQFPNVSGDAAGLADFRADMKKYQPAAAVDTVSLRSWASVQLFAKVAATIKGDITRESVLKAMNGTKNLDFYWVGKLSFDKPGPLSKFPRIIAPRAYPLMVKGDEYVASGNPISLGD